MTNEKLNNLIKRSIKDTFKLYDNICIVTKLFDKKEISKVKKEIYRKLNKVELISYINKLDISDADIHITQKYKKVIIKFETQDIIILAITTPNQD